MFVLFRKVHGFRFWIIGRPMGKTQFTQFFCTQTFCLPKKKFPQFFFCPNFFFAKFCFAQIIIYFIMPNFLIFYYPENMERKPVFELT